MYEHDRREAEEHQERLAKPYCTVRPPESQELHRMMWQYLSYRGLSPELARRNGWYPSMEAGGNIPRLVIPAVSSDPMNLYWQARAMGDGPRRYESPHGVSRGDALVIVFPVDQAKGCVVVEGPMAALAAAGEGYCGLALLGATPPDVVVLNIVDLLRRYPRPVQFLLDADGLAIRTAVHIVHAGVPLLIKLPYPHKDLAAAPAGERRRLLA